MSSDSPWGSLREFSSSDGEIAAFCDELRNTRRWKNISLETIAQKTGLSLTLLQALETGQWREIEKPFLLGYLRLYAQAVGLSPDQALARFRELSKREEPQKRARMDETGELLPRYEVVGATRMKIVFWGFVASRRFTFALFLLLLFAFLAIVASANRKPKSEEFEIPFEQTLSHAQSVSHGPIEFLSEEWVQSPSPMPTAPRARELSAKAALYDLVALEPCWIEFRRDDGTELRRHLQTLDTLRIAVRSHLFLTVEPAGRAQLFAQGQRIPPSTSSRAVADTFDVTARQEGSIGG